MYFIGWQEKYGGDMYAEGNPYIANAPTVFTAVLEIFYSDGNGGYYALMPINNPNDHLTLDLSDKQSGFSFTLYNNGGAEGDYCDSNDGMLIVKAPENMVVKGTGSGNTEYNYDYLRFYNGSGSNNTIGNSKNSGGFIIHEENPVTTPKI